MGTFATLYLLPRETVSQISSEALETTAVKSLGSSKVETKKALPPTTEDFTDVVGLTDEEVGLVRPNTGMYGVPAKKRLAPFKIRVSTNADYFARLTDRSGNDVASFFIRAGETMESKMPLGTFNLFYAAGSTWFGPKELFGEDTIYSVVGERFSFSKDGEGFNGVEVELILQSNGNLSTERISREEFLNGRHQQ